MKPAVRLILAPIGRRHRGPTWLLGKAHGRTIHLDPRCRDIARTLLHELLHVRHPSWSEAAVRVEEKRRWDRMTWREKARLYQMLGSAQLEGEE